MIVGSGSGSPGIALAPDDGLTRSKVVAGSEAATDPEGLDATEAEGSVEWFPKETAVGEAEEESPTATESPLTDTLNDEVGAKEADSLTFAVKLLESPVSLTPVAVGAPAMAGTRLRPPIASSAMATAHQVPPGWPVMGGRCTPRQH